MPVPDSQEDVDSVMRRWPETIRVFIRLGLSCVGCPIAPFHSIEEASVLHGADLRDLLEQLRGAAEASEPDAKRGDYGAGGAGLPSAIRKSL